MAGRRDAGVGSSAERVAARYPRAGRRSGHRSPPAGSGGRAAAAGRPPPRPTRRHPPRWRRPVNFRRCVRPDRWTSTRRRPGAVRTVQYERYGSSFSFPFSCWAKRHRPERNARAHRWHPLLQTRQCARLRCPLQLYLDARASTAARGNCPFRRGAKPSIDTERVAQVAKTCSAARWLAPSSTCPAGTVSFPRSKGDASGS